MKSELDQYYAAVDYWKRKNITSAEELEAVWSNFRIIFAYNSGAIENPEITYHTTREIFENGKIINFTGDIRTVFEIRNQKICSDWLINLIIKKQEITPSLIKKIHKSLMDGTYDERRYLRGECPGEYKKHDYVVGNDQGTLPEAVDQEVQKLCAELRDIPDKEDNIVKTAAYLHCKLENIHPFADGNGRVGRTLMNYFFMINDYPPIVIRSETKDQYYRALGKYDTTGDISDFVSYIKSEAVMTWQKPEQMKKKLSAYVKK